MTHYRITLEYDQNNPKNKIAKSVYELLNKEGFDVFTAKTRWLKKTKMEENYSFQTQFMIDENESREVKSLDKIIQIKSKIEKLLKGIKLNNLVVE